MLEKEFISVIILVLFVLPWLFYALRSKPQKNDGKNFADEETSKNEKINEKKFKGYVSVKDKEGDDKEFEGTIYINK